LLELRDRPEFSQVAAYLQGEGPDLRRYHLAGRIAGLFDQYLVYRPDWIEDWSAGGDDKWQSVLWRQLVARHGSWHRAAMLAHFADMVRSGAEYPCPLPERISIFGIPSLPPSQLQCFALLAEQIDVHLFLLAPSVQFWTDLAGRREMVGAEIRHAALDLENDLHLEEGCPLLMGLGTLGQEFQGVLQLFDAQPGLDAFPEASPDTALRLVQFDLNVAVRQPVLSGGDRQMIVPDQDRSIQIHVAHSPLREVEILHDQILDLLSSHPELEADDILVMMPEIDRYAPFVEAIFSDSGDGGRRLPFSIADRIVLGPLTRSFVALLDLISSRVMLSQVLAFLEQEAVESGFGLSGEDVLLIRSWLNEAGVNWGLSAEHRGRFGVPEEPIGTWRSGIDQLLMGFLTPGDGRQLVNGLLPCDVLESGHAVVLAKCINFFEALSALVDQVQSPRTLTGWRDIFTSVLDRFFGVDEGYSLDRQSLLFIFDGLARNSALSGSGELLSLEVVVAAIKQGLNSSTGNFLSCGRITMCQMVPMRSIPFKVICLLGMNDTVFPRQERRPGFDLMAASRRSGDRNRRDDDRYLFLETILSAREVLYVSYVGMNASNVPVPPSVVVSELLDHLAGRLGLDASQCADRFVTRHPLQPFSRRYFNGELFTYSVLARSLAASLGNDEPWRGLFAEGRELDSEPQERIELDDLIRFFGHPVRALLRGRLGLYLDERDEQLADRERFSLDGLDAYTLTSSLLLDALAEEDHDLCPIAQIRGEVSLGMTGRCQYEELRHRAETLAERLVVWRGHGPLPAQEVRLDLGGRILVGQIRDLWENGQVLCRPGRVKKMSHTDLIRSWIRHLALCAASPEQPWQTTFVYRDGVMRYPFVATARELLMDLVSLYSYGQGRPLPLFAKASLAYAKKRWTAKGGTPEQAMAVAWSIWSEGDYLSDPERCDPYLAAVYGDRDPLAESGPCSFAEVAELVLAPALNAAEEELF
ncbi:MAG: exodeoxyribonuclease V subunit gamma, partial [Proteobacteria bacterium]|nr:exodeoxyribonuclease V subunit gamma [Pseudomonadota bacterium]